MFLSIKLSWTIVKGITNGSTQDGPKGAGGCEGGGGAGEGGGDPVVDKPPVPLLHVFLGRLDIRGGRADIFSLDIGGCLAQHSPPPPGAGN